MAVVAACAVAALLGARTGASSASSTSSASAVRFVKPRVLASYDVDRRNGVPVVPGRVKTVMSDRELQARLPLSLDDVRAHAETPTAKTASLGAHITPILRSMQSAGIEAHRFRFVSFRNNFNKLLNTPYAPQEAWSVELMRVSNSAHTHGHAQQHEQGEQRATQPAGEGARASPLDTIFMNVVERPEQLDPQSIAHRASLWGLRFEQLAMADDEDRARPDVEHCRLFELQYDGMPVLLAAEIDGARADGTVVELKTSRLIENDRQRQSFERHKLLKFWIQSYLVATPQIVVGFRDDGGVVRKVQTLATADLPSFGKRHWDAQAVLAFGAGVLAWLLQHVPVERPCVLDYVPQSRSLVLRALSPSAAFLPPEWLGAGAPSGAKRVHGTEQ